MQERLRQGPGSRPCAQLAEGSPETASAPPPSRWTLARIREAFDWLGDYSLAGIHRLLSGLGLRLRSARVQHYSPDRDYEAKEARLLACLEQVAGEPEGRALLFLDEMGYYRWPAPAKEWAAQTPVAQRADPNNQQWRLIGALNALSGQVDYADGYIIGRKQVGAFYRQLDQRYAGVKRVFVVQDNWSIHTHPDVVAVLSGLPRLEVVPLPTYAPWLNPIEKLWRWLRQDVLKMHRLGGDFAALRQQVRTFLDQFAHGSQDLLRYVGLAGEGKLARALARPDYST